MVVQTVSRIFLNGETPVLESSTSYIGEVAKEW